MSEIHFKVWVVSQSSGSYDEYRIWPVRVFAYKAEAERWMAENNPIFRRKMQRLEESCKRWLAKREALEEKNGLWTEDGNYTPAYAKLLEKEPKGNYYDQHGYSLNEDPIPFHHELRPAA